MRYSGPYTVIEKYNKYFVAILNSRQVPEALSVRSIEAIYQASRRRGFYEPKRGFQTVNNDKRWLVSCKTEDFDAVPGRSTMVFSRFIW